MKILTILGTRPEIIRLSAVIRNLDKYFDHELVHTGQNYDYELNQIFFEDLGLRKPDIYLNSKAKNAVETIAKILKQIDRVLSVSKPDAVVVLGDTNSAISVYAAKRRKIPIFHIEAGNRCFNQNVPEEINRKVVDHISDVNITYSKFARENLLREGLDPEMSICLGSPMKEIINYCESISKKSKILRTLGLKKNEYILFSTHREENVDSPRKFKEILKIIKSLNTKFGKKIVMGVHPRIKKKIDSEKFDKNFIMCPPFAYSEYLKLQTNAYCVVSDSGTITEESSILGFPAVNFREQNERQEGYSEGAIVMSGIEEKNVVELVDFAVRAFANSKMNIVEDYNVDNFSDKFINLIVSKVEHINRKVWKKY